MRLRIPTEDEVNFANHFLREKAVTYGDAPKKNATQEDIDRMTKRAVVDHEKMGASSGLGSLESMAQSM
eukprot:14621397-Alexandrium_andersonii.AAC.1